MGREKGKSVAVKEKRDKVVVESIRKHFIHLQGKVTRNQVTQATRPS